MALKQLTYLLALGLSLPVMTEMVAPPPAAAQTAVQSRDLPAGVAEAYHELVGPGVGFAERTAAAHLLLRAGGADADAALQALRTALGQEQPLDVWRAVLQSVSVAEGQLPEDLLPAMWGLMSRMDDPALLSDWATAMGRYNDSRVRRDLENIAEDDGRGQGMRVAAIRAMGHMREKAMAKSLVDLTDGKHPELVQRAAYAALADLTGITSYNADRQAWVDWYKRMSFASDGKWHRHLVENFTRRDATRRSGTEQLEGRLLESQKALYRATIPQDRPGVLGYMLADPLEPIRELGMELALQRLLDGQPFDEPLRVALRERLVDSQPRIRTRAALLLRDLADTPSADIVARRLASSGEQVPDVLSAYLKMMASMPRSGVIDTAYQLLMHESLRDDAAGALAAAYDAGLIDGKTASRLLKRVQKYLKDDSQARQSPPPHVVTLLGKIGQAKDWEQIAQWVSHSNSVIKQAAAKAWAASDHSLNLLAKQAGDPIIRPIVIVAATERGSDPWTLQSLALHQPEQQQENEAWQRALTTMAGRVTPEALLPTVNQLKEIDGSDALREAMMTACIDKAGEQESPGVPHLELLLERGETRRIMGKPSEAVADYEQLALHADKLSDKARDRLERGSIRAYLTLNQITRVFEVATRLFSVSSGRAADDPIVGLFIETAKKKAEQDSPELAAQIIQETRKLLGVQIKPEMAQRMRSVEWLINQKLEAAPKPPAEKAPATPASTAAVPESGA